MAVIMDGMSEKALSAWEAFKERTGTNPRIISAFRDAERNREVGGAKNSQHIHGNAFDIDVSGMSHDERRNLIREARAAGFLGIGVYDNSLHFDVGPARGWGPDYTRNSVPEWARDMFDGSMTNGAEEKPSRLLTFGEEANKEAENFVQMAARIFGNDFSDALSERKETAPQPNLGFGSAVPQGASPFVAQGMPNPIRMGPTALTFGPGMAAADPNMGALSMGTKSPSGMPPIMAGGQPLAIGSDLPLSTGVPAAGGGAAVGASTGTSARSTPAAAAIDGEVVEEDPLREGFLTQLGGMLFPDAEDKPQVMKDFLGGLGVAMGQMSAGQPVDLSPYFANIQAQRQAAADAEQRAAQDAIDTQISAMNAETSRLNAQLAASRLQFDMEQFDYERAEANAPRAGLDPALVEQYADDKQLAPFIAMMNSQDDKMYESGVQGFKEVLAQRAQNATSPVNSQAISDLVRAFDAGDMDAVSEIIANNPLSTEDIKRVAEIADPGQLIKNARRLAGDPNMPQEVVDQAMRLSRLAGGLSDSTVDMDRYKDGRTYFANLRATSDRNRALAFNVNDMRNRALDAAKAGTPIEGIGEDWIAAGLNASRRMLPPDWQARLETEVGVPLSEYQAMNSLEKMIVLQAAVPLMKGQGTITDIERKALAESLVNTEQNFETQMDILDRMQVLNDIDAALVRYYNDNLADEFHSNTDELQTDITLEVGAALPELYKGRLASTAAKNIDASPAWRAEFYNQDGTMKSTEQILTATAPRLTRKQYEMFKSVLTDGLWYDVGTGKFMTNDEVLELPN